MIREAIVREARSWINTRFHHQARVKGIGCDCAGLVIGVCRELGLSNFDKSDYSRIPDGAMLKQTCDENMTLIPFDDAQIGDVLLFKFNSHPQHLALIGDYPSGGFSIIHAYSLARKVIETRLDDVWLARVVACYRLPGVM
jgi:NlpC/P60 family putative phage cell wall peptidase